MHNNMVISKPDVAEFQKIYKKQFNSSLNYDTAYHKLSLLVRQLEVAYVPITKQQAAKYDNENMINNVESTSNK